MTCVFLATILGTGYKEVEWAGLAVLLLLLLLFLFTRLYHKPRADQALVRTGWRGMRLVYDRGILVLPCLHHLKTLSLATVPLTISCTDKASLITSDHYRADVTVNFYLQVAKNQEDIEKAARCLGDQTLNADSIMRLVRDKLVGALRDVAATYTLQQLHEKRRDFAQAVRQALKQDLAANGLTLESICITQLNQTAKSAYDKDNIFDARGLQAMIAVTEQARQEQFEITCQTDVEIKRRQEKSKVECKQAEIESRKQQLALEREGEFALVEQQKAVANYRTEHEAQQEHFRIEQAEMVKKRDIEKERVLLQAELEKQRLLQQAEINKQRDLEIARQDKQITIIRKQRETELEEVKKLTAVAERAKAQQTVFSVEAVEQAQREKHVTLIQQRAQSEKEKIKQEVAADAAAYELQKEAEAQAVAAEQQALAIERLAQAALVRAQHEAQGNRLLFEAKNTVSTQVLVQEVVLKALENLPQILQEAMKPVEKISDIKVLQLQGLASPGQESNQVVSTLLQAGVAMPLLRELLKFADVDSDNLSLSEIARKAIHSIPAVAAAVEKVPESLRNAQASSQPPAGS